MTIRGLSIRIAGTAPAAVTPTPLIGAGSYITRADRKTLPARSVTKIGARPGALVAPNGAAVRVDRWLTHTGGATRTVALGSVAAHAPLTTLRRTVTALTVGTRYNVKSVAINGGTKTSSDTNVSFTTKR